MKVIVFLNTQKSGSSREAIISAKQLGYETILLTNRISQLQTRDDFPDVSEMIYCDVDNIDDLRLKIKNLQKNDYEIASIISFIDSYGYTASILAQEFGVGCFNSEAIQKMQDKTKSRECLSKTDYVPWYKIMQGICDCNTKDIKSRLPLILKNPQSTGSKDVYLVTTVEEFYDKYELLSKGGYHEVIVEEYLDGPQFLVETIVENNEVHLIAIIEQEIYLYKGHSIVVGYNIHHNLSEEFMNSLKKAVNDIIKQHGMDYGSCHLEMRYVKRKWKLIEINPRISGGGMNEFIRYGLGINLVKETIKLSLREPLDIEPKFRLYTHAEYLICNLTGRLLKVTGRNEAYSCDGVISVFIKPRIGQMIYPPVSMGYRYAYVIANGYNETDARIKAKIALNKIKLHILKE